MARAGARRAARGADPAGAWRTGLAEILLALGQRDDAHRELDELARDDFAVIPRDPAWRYGMCGAAAVAAALAHEEHCAVIYRMLEPSAGLGVLLGPIAYHAVVDRYLGLLAAALARPDDAIRA